jgi:hypothetical protein
LCLPLETLFQERGGGEREGSQNKRKKVSQERDQGHHDPELVLYVPRVKVHSHLVC